jgi:hypothetical protein
MAVCGNWPSAWPSDATPFSHHQPQHRRRSLTSLTLHSHLAAALPRRGSAHCSLALSATRSVRLSICTQDLLHPRRHGHQWVRRACPRCESSFRLCCSCSHSRPCVWRPILVHNLCPAAALRHANSNPTSRSPVAAHESGRGRSCSKTTAMVGLVGTLALRPDSLPHL